MSGFKGVVYWMCILWIWVLGIELDIFIIGVNPTRDSRKIQREFPEA
eukprot:COSAG01_NODE_11901_length_1837_cov_3.728423_1_plen_46_part_01